MKTLYHGSPLGNLQTLEPRFDRRLGVTGIFVSDEPYGPMLFSLLPESAVAEVDYRTEGEKFIRGTVKTPALNDEGFVYTIEVPEEMIQEKASGGLYLSLPVQIIRQARVRLEDVMKLGWQIEKVLL